MTKNDAIQRKGLLAGRTLALRRDRGCGRGGNKAREAAGKKKGSRMRALALVVAMLAGGALGGWLPVYGNHCGDGRGER